MQQHRIALMSRQQALAESIIAALGLPDTVSKLKLEIEANKLATLEITMWLRESDVTALEEVFKRWSNEI